MYMTLGTPIGNVAPDSFPAVGNWLKPVKIPAPWVAGLGSRLKNRRYIRNQRNQVAPTARYTRFLRRPIGPRVTIGGIVDE